MKKKSLVLFISLFVLYFVTCFVFGEKKLCFGGTDIFESHPPLRDSLVIFTNVLLSKGDKEFIRKKELKKFKNISFITENKKAKYYNVKNNIYSFHSERFLTFMVLNSECIYLYGKEPYLECHDVLYVWFFYKWIRVKKKLSLIS